LKILQLAQCYPPSVGGMQSYVANFCTRLATDHGHEVSVWTTDAWDNPASPDTRRITTRRERLDGVDVERFGYVTAHRPVTRAASRAAKRLRMPGVTTANLITRGPLAPRMAYGVLRSDADVITAAAFDYLHMRYPRGARRLGRRFGLVYMGLLHLTDRPLDRGVLRTISAADAYVALTTFERDFLVRAGVTGPDLVVIPPGIDFDRYQVGDPGRIRSELGLADEPIVAYVGRQARYKGVPLLLEAMGEVWPAVPEARLVIAGATTNYSPELRAAVDALPSSQRERVAVLDDIDETTKIDLLAAADVFVSVSAEESFGISYLEAWAANTPVIGADIGAVRSVIREDGIVVDPQDAAELARAIERLLGDDALRAELAQAGRLRAQIDHDWDILVKDVDRVYAEAARRGAA
jgi:glycosyltransferase involved in cell wall biosynthesis